uniref:Putative tail tape measure protein n=1 Tax=viral metagenome TaxID=1070528 RepID=A0A6M3KWM7_9ZZZZ
MADAKLEIILKAKDMIAGTFASVQRRIQQFGATATRAFSGIGRSLLSLKTLAIGALAGWGIKATIGDMIEVGAGFEKLKLSLDTITKGKGEEWFKKLNEWALKMPVNTQEAIKAFQMLRAMGLDPSIAQMTTLVDTMGALGGTSEMLSGISRALGQMATKGKVVQQELNQLAERGIPIFDILREKFSLTSEQLGEIGKVGLNAGEVIEKIFEGLAERFGGQSAKMQTSWEGLMTTIISYWNEFQRLIMEAGVLDYLKDRLKEVVTWMDRIYSEGTLKKWADETGAKITEKLTDVYGWIQRIGGWIKNNWDGINQTFKVFYDVIASIAKAFKYVGELIGKVTAEIVLFSETLARTKIGQKIQDIVFGGAEAVIDKIPLNNIFNQATESANNTAKAVEKVEKAVEKVNDQASEMIMRFDEASQTWTNLPGPTIEPMIKKSPAVSWQQGINSMMADLEGLGTTIQQTFDMTAIAALMGSMSSTAARLGALVSMETKMGSRGYSAPIETGVLQQILKAQETLLSRALNPPAPRIQAVSNQPVTINLYASTDNAEELARQIKDELAKLDSRGY